MSGVLPLIVTSEVDPDGRCDRRGSTVDDVQARPAPIGVLGECDVPPPRGRMKHMIHQAVVDRRLPRVRYINNKLTGKALGGAHLLPTKVFRWLTGLLNKTIVKPRLAAAANTSDFPDLKFRV